MKRFVLFLVLIIAVSSPAAPKLQLEALHSNGALLVAGEDRLPLRCLDQPGLLSKAAADQDALLDRAAAAGFNSISFEAPVFGSQGFCQKLGNMNAERVSAFQRLVAACQFRHLYAFPVLWTSASVAEFAQNGGGEAAFYTGKTQNQWQAWLTRELLKSSGSGVSLSSTAAIGAWVLWRGLWMGPQKRDSAPEISATAQPFTAPLRGWLLWQLRALRVGGAVQMSMVDIVLKHDLGSKASAADEAASLSETAVPVAELKNEATILADPSAMDHLPPLAGAEPEGGETAIAADALTPWDLEGVDWDSVGRALGEIPAATGLDLLSLTLDTEDWYRVGEAMAASVEANAQVPVLWRHDWRSASRYERQKRLEAPAAMAGLIGPWPENDWPEDGESIWPVEEKGTAGMGKALFFKYYEVVNEGGKPRLSLHLNRPCTLSMNWGKRWPPDKVSASTDKALVHKLDLKGVKFGDMVLVCARAESKSWGRAVLKSRWIQLKESPAAKAAPKAKH